MNKYLLLLGAVSMVSLSYSTAIAQDNDSDNSSLLPMSLDDIGEFAKETLRANKLDKSSVAETNDDASPEQEQKKEIDIDSITSPIQGWGTSIMFGLSERRELQEVLDSIARLKYLESIGKSGEANQEDIAEAEQEANTILDDLQKQLEDAQNALEGNTDTAPTDTTVGDDGTTYIGDVNKEAIDPTQNEPPLDQRGTQTYQTERGPIQAPNMFLNSILYKSPTEWLIWINDKQVTSDSTLEAASIKDVEIVRITPTKLILHWHTSDLDRILPEERSEWPKHRQIIIDESDGIVKFILYPNQGFLGRNIEMTEGRPSVIPEPPRKGNVAGSSKKKSTTTKKNTKSTTGSKASQTEQSNKPEVEREIMNRAIRLYEGLQDHGKSKN